MSDYQHILVGLDLSEDSPLILKKAKALGQSIGAKISIMHVLEPLSFAYGGDIPIDLSETQNIMEDQATRRLEKLCLESDLSPETQTVAVGQTAHEIHSAAERYGADLIVVGSHGRHGLALLMGSTASGVLKGAQCDVLAVRV